MQLAVGTEYPIHVSGFGSCSSFFIQIIDDADGWEELVKMLHEIEFLEPLNEMKVGKLCLVDTESGLSRAKIIRSSEDTTMCFCVDDGELVYFQHENERIYEIPPQILSFMPFQAVNCRLAGIHTPKDFAWTSMIFNKVIKRITLQRIRVLKKIEKNPDIIPWGLENVNSYEVILLDTATDGKDVNVNELLVKYQLAENV
jgi:hypothetical protein